MQKILLLLLMILIVAAAWLAHRLARKWIDPRRSAGHFFLFILLNLALVFALSLGVGYLIITNKEFFFKG